MPRTPTLKRPLVSDYKAALSWLVGRVGIDLHVTKTGALSMYAQGWVAGYTSEGSHYPTDTKQTPQELLDSLMTHLGIDASESLLACHFRYKRELEKGVTTPWQDSQLDAMKANLRTVLDRTDDIVEGPMDEEEEEDGEEEEVPTEPTPPTGRISKALSATDFQQVLQDAINGEKIEYAFDDSDVDYEATYAQIELENGFDIGDEDEDEE